MQLHDEGMIDMTKIETVELQSPPTSAGVNWKKNPRDGLESKFSVCHGAACGLLFGRATPTEYKDEVVSKLWNSEVKFGLQSTSRKLTNVALPSHQLKDATRNMLSMLWEV